MPLSHDLVLLAPTEPASALANRQAAHVVQKVMRPCLAAMRTLLTVLLVWMGFHCSAQCPYDFNGDGYISVGSGEALLILGNLGVDTPEASAETDFNNSGITDVTDVLEFARHLGQWCPITEIPETDDRILGLSLAVHHVHDVGVNGLLDTVPEGFVTYRLYLEVTDNDDRITGVFGIDENPLLLSGTAPLWNNEVLGAHTANNIDTEYLDVLPSLAYDSWLSDGHVPEAGAGSASSPIPTAMLIGGVEDWYNQEAEMAFDQPVGGGVVVIDYFSGTPQLPNLRCIGQFTLPADATLEGTINVETIRGNGGSTISFERKLGLTFSTDNLAELGCTDPNAENYSPAATLNDGTCTYFSDLDGDGVIDTDDLLFLLGNFGCTSCDDLDLDGGGILGVGDILILLGLL